MYNFLPIRQFLKTALCLLAANPRAAPSPRCETTTPHRNALRHSCVSHYPKSAPWETPSPIRSHQGHVSCFPPAEIRVVGNTQPHQKPPEPRPLFPTASNNRLLTPPGTPSPLSAPGNVFSVLPGAPERFFAPGNRFSLLPRAPGPFSAPGNGFSLLRGALGTLSAPGGHSSFSRSRRDGKVGRENRV